MRQEPPKPSSHDDQPPGRIALAAALAAGFAALATTSCADVRAARKSAAHVAVEAAQSMFPASVAEPVSFDVVRVYEVSPAARIVTIKVKIKALHNEAEAWHALNKAGDESVAQSARLLMEIAFGRGYRKGQKAERVYSVTVTKEDDTWAATSIREDNMGSSTLQRANPVKL